MLCQARVKVVNLTKGWKFSGIQKYSMKLNAKHRDSFETMLVQHYANLLEKSELFLDNMDTLYPSKHLDALCYTTRLSAKLRCAAYAQRIV